MGQAVISSETLQIYSVVKFYFDNLKLGVFPFWDPFVMWGESTQIFLNYAGIYNPFWLTAFILNVCGMSFYQSFLFSITLYFWVGQWGFYLLAKTVLQDSRAAYFAFLLFLFSSVSMSVFAQYHPQLLYIPSIWFFYFFISFFRNPSPLACAGLALTAAVILTSYLPFYFLTVFTVVTLLIVVLNCSAIKKSLSQSIGFFKRHFVLALISLGIVVLSFFPGYYAYQSTVHKEVVAPFRNGNVVKRAGVDFNEYDKVSKNGFASRMDPEDLYANLDIIQYGDDCFFFVSIFLYLLVIMGAALRVNKVMAVSGLTGLFLFFLIMAGGTGFHRFLFDHIPYFKLIRNMHFFLPFFLAAVIILAAEQLRSYFETVLSKLVSLRATEGSEAIFFSTQRIASSFPAGTPRNDTKFHVSNGLYRRKMSRNMDMYDFENVQNLTEKKRKLFFLFAAVVHITVIIFLSRQPHVVLSSFLALALSFLFWTLLFLDQKRPKNLILSAVLFLAVVVQPCEVIWRHNQKALEVSSYSDKKLIETCVRVPSVKPDFIYTRPIDSREIGNDDTAYSRIAMKDASRFFENGFPTFWSYSLTLKEPFSDLQQYTHYKFYVYADEKVLEDPIDLNTAAAITGPSEYFKVTAFDVNSIKIKTGYSEEKLLVYTDSYHKNWKARVNGKPAVIDRANMAFKGIRLGPGANEVELRYSNPMIMTVSMALPPILFLTFLYLVWMLVKERNAKDHV